MARNQHHKDDVELSVTEEKMEEAPDWEVGFCDCKFVGGCCCCLAFVPCVGDRIVMAYALTEMEGQRGSVCFHAWCASTCVARSYVREVYGIRGSAGWDCCLSLCCRGCNAAQLLGHVYVAGKPPMLPDMNPDLAANFAGIPAEWRELCCFDPCNALHNMLCFHCMSAAHVSAVTGLPMWLPLAYSCYCFNHHIIRVNYGIPGASWWSDCLEPVLCSLLYIPPVTFFGIFVNCCYYTQMLEYERQTIIRANANGHPRLFLNSNISADITTSQPHRADPPPTAAVAVHDDPSSSSSPPSLAGPTTTTTTSTAQHPDTPSIAAWLFPYALVTTLATWVHYRVAGSNDADAETTPPPHPTPPASITRN